MVLDKIETDYQRVCTAIGVPVASSLAALLSAIASRDTKLTTVVPVPVKM